MKKQTTEVKKLRVGKETLIPLGSLVSLQANEVAGGITTLIGHNRNTLPVHI